MDRDGLWTRRSRPSLNSYASDKRESRGETSTRQPLNSKRNPSTDFPSLGRSASGSLAINTNVSGTSGASSAFGLGSGAFASFGASGKTPKTAAPALDAGKSGTYTPSAETLKSGKTAPRDFPTQRTRKDTSDGSDDEDRWSLKCTWVIWYRPPTGKVQDYEKSIKPLCRVSSAQEFWRVYSHLKPPSALPIVSDYHIFKEHIRPVWEDDENKNGGKWILRLKKGVIDRYWEDLLLAIVGDQFAEAGEEVCGMVVSIRNGEDVLNIWTRNNGGRNVKIRETIKRVLSLPTETSLVFKSHDDSIAQRTAIDQARNEKGASDKRRHTGTDNANKEKTAG